MASVGTSEPTRRRAGIGGRNSVARFWAFGSWVDENVFPEAPPPPRLTLRRGLLSVALGVAIVGVELARIWSSKPLNSIWAEDGATWLADAIHRGFLDTLTTPYDGYLQ